MRNIIFIAALLVSLTANAQVNPKEGFIITNLNDTVYGMVDYRNNDKNAQQCSFKADGASEYVTYTPGQIAGYRFKESGKFYVSRNFDENGEFFAEYLVNGILNLYRREIGYRKIYYIENENGEVVRYENFDEHLDYDEREAKVKAQGLVSQVYKSKRATDDVKVGKMTDKQMIKMARDYHEDVCTSGDECIQYEYDAKKEKIKVYPTIYAGGGYVKWYEEGLCETIDGGVFYSLGAGIDIDASRYYKGMMFQLSLIYSKISNKIVDSYTCSFTSYSLNIGPMFRFGRSNSVKFTLRTGLVFNGFHITIDSNQDNESYDLFPDIYTGIYGGCGLELPIGKHAVNFNVDYKCYGWGKVGMFQGTVGFRI